MDAKTLCLGILTRGDASGYEIRKAFENGPFHHCFDVGYGSIYPALNRLAEEGLVSCRAEAQDKRPDKKVYSITPKGRLAFVDSLMEPLAPDKLRSEFLFFLFFADMLPAAHIEKVMDARLEELQERINRMESHECAPRDQCHKFVHGYGLAIYKAAATFIEENKHVLLRESLLTETGNENAPVAAAQ